MAAGIAGLESVYTAQAALDLNALGDSMRTRLNAICHARAVPLQFSGLGSMMNFHPTRAPVRSVADLSSIDNRVRDLFFFFMLERGFYLARRGFVALSLPVTDVEVERFIAAFGEFVDLCGPLLEPAA